LKCPHCGNPLPFGRPQKADIEIILGLIDSGYKMHEIAEEMEVSISYVYYLKKKHRGITPPDSSSHLE
jgi:hypothetical protein